MQDRYRFNNISKKHVVFVTEAEPEKVGTIYDRGGGGSNGGGGASGPTFLTLFILCWPLLTRV
jgi:hypothetical protein